MVNSNSATEIPIACTPTVFSKAELAEHVSRGMDVLFRRPTRTAEHPEGFVFEYLGNEKLFLELARFAYNEHRCCPWVSFAIEMGPFVAETEGVLRLRYIGGERGKALLSEAFERLRVAAFDPEAERRLLHALGALDTICHDNKDALYTDVAGPAAKSSA